MKKIFHSLFEAFRRLMQWLLTKPVNWAAAKFSSAPDKQLVFDALTKLYQETIEYPGEKKGTMLQFDPQHQRIIIFSDHHKGTRNGSDDFTTNEPCYLAALDYYNQHQYCYINLGDSEELWENNILRILKPNKLTFEKERLFINRNAYYKIYGNHDAMYRFDPLTPVYLKQMYGKSIHIYGGVVLRATIATGKHIDILCTHGHQGDNKSDGNWFSAWFVATIWAPLQRFLRLNPNTPSCNNEMKSLHNRFMYEWSAEQQNLVLITGHTHQPVFNSLTHLERLYLEMEKAREKNDQAEIDRITKELPKREQQYSFINANYRLLKPTYFNAGCCCFNNGNITGIEISDGYARLVKWTNETGTVKRIIAEETSLDEIAAKITA